MINTKLKYQTLYTFLLLVVLVGGCVDPYWVELDDKDSQSILVVDGLITTEPGSFKVSLRRSVPLDTLSNYTPEYGAQVYILDDKNNRFDLIDSGEGVYKCLDESVKAETGVTYQLFITDVFNKQYESSPILVEASPEIENLGWEETKVIVFEDNEAIEKKALDIVIDAKDPSEQTKYYQWDFEETFEVMMPNAITALDGMGKPYDAFVKVPDEKKYCWVTLKPKNILLKSVANQSNSNIDNYVVLRIGELDDRLLFRYSIKVSQYRVNKEMYNFWKKLKDINENAGSLYDQVPSAVYGNITCCDDETSALGYFNAVDVKSKRIFIESYEHSLPTYNYYEGCLYVSDQTNHHFVDYFYARSAFCSDCRVYGSNIKPDFW